MSVFNNVQLNPELDYFWNFRRKRLTFDDQVTQEDYGLAISEEKEKIIHLNLRRFKRKQKSDKANLIQDFEQTIFV